MNTENTDAATTVIEGQPLIDYIGINPLIIAGLAICIGISALIIRRKVWIQSSLIFELALGSLGVAITCWRFFWFNLIFAEYEGELMPDIGLWLSEFAISWSSAAISLFGVSIGLLLIGIAWIFNKPNKTHQTDS